MSAFTHSGQVYFISCGAYVKIGYTSTHIANRLYALKRDPKGMRSPADLDIKAERMTILRLIPDCIMRDERRIQGLFAAHHEVGEWYRLTPAFLRHLQQLDYVTDRAVLANFREQRRLLKRIASRRAAA